jgi:hypothetical protein
VGAVQAGLGGKLEARDHLVGLIGLGIVEKPEVRAIHAPASPTADAQSRPVDSMSTMSNSSEHDLERLRRDIRLKRW